MGCVLIRHSAVDHRRVFDGSRFTGLVCEGETVGQAREVDEMGERTCGCGQWQVRQRTRHDTWMTIILRTHKCAILILSHACSLDEMLLCCATQNVLYLWVYCSHPPVGWLEVFLQTTETCPNSEKNHHSSGLENAENSNCSTSTRFGPMQATMTKLLAGWPAILTQMTAGFSATVCGTSNLFSGQRRRRNSSWPSNCCPFRCLTC